MDLKITSLHKLEKILKLKGNGSIYQFSGTINVSNTLEIGVPGGCAITTFKSTSDGNTAIINSADTTVANYLDIKDIIFVDPKKLDRQKSIEIANSISRINASMINENRPYLLIGPGRWGSSDNLLGIPVKWGQISGARTIIECELADILSLIHI